MASYDYRENESFGVEGRFRGEDIADSALWSSLAWGDRTRGNGVPRANAESTTGDEAEAVHIAQKRRHQLSSRCSELVLLREPGLLVRCLGSNAKRRTEVESSLRDDDRSDTRDGFIELYAHSCRVHRQCRHIELGTL